MQYIDILGPASALENMGFFRNILHCPCVKIQGNIHVSLYISYDLRRHISDVFRFILSHNQGDKYKEINVCEYTVTLQSITYTSHYIQITAATDIVLRFCYSLFLTVYMDVILVKKIED